MRIGLQEYHDMKITGNSTTPKTTASASASGTGRTGAAARRGATQDTSATATTDPTARLSQLEAQFAQADFSAGKVGEISAAISSGSYQINAGAIADKLIATSAELARSSGKSA
jgi:negative regulator of flagellin synthesis FlgM